MNPSLKRLLSVLLCLCMVAAMTALPVLADDATQPTLSEEEQRKAAEIDAQLEAIDKAADKKAEQTVLLREQAADQYHFTLTLLSIAVIAITIACLVVVMISLARSSAAAKRKKKSKSRDY